MFSIPISKHATFDHRLSQFFDEQRHAISSVNDLVSDLPRQRLSTCKMINHLSTLVMWQAVKSNQCRVRKTDPAGPKLRTEGHQNQDWEGRRQLNDKIK